MYNNTYLNTIGVNMGLLQYTSDEMFSSTELVRKSKMIFDKLNDNEIEKAIILRDGKPSFILYDFKRYESLAKEYIAIKKELEELKNLKKTNNQNSKETQTLTQDKVNNIIPEKKIEEKIQNNMNNEINIEDNKSKDEIDNKELSKALEEIDNLDLIIKDDGIDKKPESLKEFWD